MPTSQKRGKNGSLARSFVQHSSHRVQHARAEAIQQALRKSLRANPRENAPKLGEIRSLGLLGHEEDTKGILQKS